MKLMVWPGALEKSAAQACGQFDNWDHHALFDSFTGRRWDTIVVMPGWDKWGTLQECNAVLDEVLPAKLTPGGQLIVLGFRSNYRVT